MSNKSLYITKRNFTVLYDTVILIDGGVYGYFFYHAVPGLRAMENGRSAQLRQ